MGLALIVVATLFLFVVVWVTVAAVRSDAPTTGTDYVTARIATQRTDAARPRSRHTV